VSEAFGLEKHGEKNTSNKNQKQIGTANELDSITSNSEVGRLGTS